MIAEEWLGLGCRRMVCNKQIINWGMPGLSSVVYGTAAQLPFLATCRWIMRRSWGEVAPGAVEAKDGWVN